MDLSKKTAIHTIEVEIEALRALKGSINDDFAHSVEAIFGTDGRVVVTGIGKSAIVAQKIVATLNSTGTPALFMHAADAIHGDLGMIRDNDVVMCLSKSGETPEIKVLVPLLKTLGRCLIAVVGRADAYLALMADYVLLTPIAHEADPNNLAPTASTTAQMAMGDALAMALLALRGFTAQDFAQFHPGGSLGKQLYLRVRDLSQRNERPQVGLHASIQHTIIEMTSKRLGATAVLDEAQRVCGVVTDGDLRRMLESRSDLSQLTAADIMGQQPKVIEEDDMAVAALRVMREHGISQLIVVRAGQYAGFVHLHDLIREGLV